MPSSEYLIKFYSNEEKKNIIELIEQNNIHFMNVLNILEKFQDFLWKDYDEDSNLEDGLLNVGYGFYIDETESILFKNMNNFYIKVKHCTVVVVRDVYSGFYGGIKCVRLFFDHEDVDIDIFLSNNLLDYSLNDKCNYQALEVIISEKGEEQVIDLGEITCFENVKEYGLKTYEYDDRDYEDR